MRANTQQVCCQDGWWHKWIWCSLASGATASLPWYTTFPRQTILLNLERRYSPCTALTGFPAGYRIIQTTFARPLEGTGRTRLTFSATILPTTWIVAKEERDSTKQLILALNWWSYCPSLFRAENTGPWHCAWLYPILLTLKLLPPIAHHYLFCSEVQFLQALYPRV